MFFLRLQEAELKTIIEEAEAQQSALKVVAHVYQEKLAIAQAACVVPREQIMKEVRVGREREREMQLFDILLCT